MWCNRCCIRHVCLIRSPDLGVCSVFSTSIVIPLTPLIPEPITTHCMYCIPCTHKAIFYTKLMYYCTDISNM